VNRPAALIAALAGPALAGVGMSFGQSVSPDALLPLFNSAAPVAAIAAATALAGRRRWQAVALAAAAGPATMAGYFGTAALRGFGVSSTWLVFWCTVGVAVGAVMGAAVWTLRLTAHDPSSPVWSGLAASVWPGMALGEAAHGIVRIGDSTPVGYWWTQCAVGVAILVATCLWRARQRLSVTVAVLGTVTIASGLFLTYGAL
jgi:hypothetical protein